MAGATTVSRMRLNSLRAEGIFGGSCSHPHRASGRCTLMPTVIHTHSDTQNTHLASHSNTIQNTDTGDHMQKHSAQSLSHGGATHTQIHIKHPVGIDINLHTHTHKSVLSIYKRTKQNFRKGPRGLGLFQVREVSE